MEDAFAYRQHWDQLAEGGLWVMNLSLIQSSCMTTSPLCMRSKSIDYDNLCRVPGTASNLAALKR